MTVQYIEGPADQRWEVAQTTASFGRRYVQRVGFEQRAIERNFALPFERHYTVEDQEQADYLCSRLNELDRALALIEAIETAIDDGSNWEHTYDGDDSGEWVICNGRETIDALIADYREGPESQVKP